MERPFDDGTKIMNQPLIGAMQAIFRACVTQSAKKEDEILKMVRDAAHRGDVSERNLLLLCHPHEALCVNEGETFLYNTSEHGDWIAYERNNDPDTAMAYSIEITDTRDGEVYGNIYVLNYEEHSDLVTRGSISTTNNYYVHFENGEKSLVTGEELSLIWKNSIQRVSYIRHEPNKSREFSKMIETEHKKRGLFVAVDGLNDHLALCRVVRIQSEQAAVERAIRSAGKPLQENYEIKLSSYFSDPIGTEEDRNRLLAGLPYDQMKIVNRGEQGDVLVVPKASVYEFYCGTQEIWATLARADGKLPFNGEGCPVKFPCMPYELAEAMEMVGAYSLSDCRLMDIQATVPEIVPALYTAELDHVNYTEKIDEINYLAGILSEQHKQGCYAFDVAMEHSTEQLAKVGRAPFSNVSSLINLAGDAEKGYLELYSIHSLHELGKACLEGYGYIDPNIDIHKLGITFHDLVHAHMDSVRKYGEGKPLTSHDISCEKYGESIHRRMKGIFTPKGYLVTNYKNGRTLSFAPQSFIYSFNNGVPDRYALKLYLGMPTYRANYRVKTEAR